MSSVHGLARYRMNNGEQIEVRRLEPEAITKDVGRTVLWLLYSSYAYQFEGTGTGKQLLPSGTVWRHFKPTSQSSAQAQADHMQASIDNGSEYWTVKRPEGYYASLVKVSPSRATIMQKLRRAEPNAYINDIVTAPHHQRQGLAGMTMHAALSQGNYAQHGPVALDAYTDDQGPQQWFTKLGLEAVNVNQAQKKQFGDEQYLSQKRMSSEGIVDLTGLVIRLADSDSWTPLPQAA